MKLLRTLIAITFLAGSTCGCHLVTKDGVNARSHEPSQLSDHFDDATSGDPIRQKIGLLQAKAALSESDGNYGEAFRCYEAILQAAPNEVPALHRLAILHTQQGDSASAERCFESALKLADHDAQLHNDFGYFCHLQQRPDAAQHHLKRALLQAPGMREAHNNLGLVYARLGRYAEAEDHFRMAGCTRAETLNNLAFGRLMEHDLKDATAIYQLALKSDPNQANARSALQTLDQHGRTVMSSRQTPPQAK